MAKPRRLILISLNEVNKHFIESYSEKYCLKNLKRLLRLPQVNTTSEKDYDLLEPWIQWASVHTGLTAKEHGVFRLGAMTGCEKSQIFEELENKGVFSRLHFAYECC